MDRATLTQHADDVLSQLAPHEELVLRLRFGIGGRRQPPDVIARRLGVDVDDVRHVESRALSHLRQLAFEEQGRECESVLLAQG